MWWVAAISSKPAENEAPVPCLPSLGRGCEMQRRFLFTLEPNTEMEIQAEMALDKSTDSSNREPPALCIFGLSRQQGTDSLGMQNGITGLPSESVSKRIKYTETLTEGGEEETVFTKLLPSSISQIPPKEKNIKCDFCSYTTHRKSHLNEHYRMKHLKVKVICDLCGKEFSSRLP